jgi:secretion/DNA translocation related CpaE-like protein
MMSTTAPLLITTDDVLAEEVQRLAAVCGCEPNRHRDPATVGEQWRTASLVLLDEAAAAGGVSCGLPRRRGVLMVTASSAPAFWRAAFEIGAEQAIELPQDEAALVEWFSDATDHDPTDPGGPDSGRVLAVLGGCGGAGASVLATATALSATRRGDQCLLLDCDRLGGGLDLAVGMEAADGLRWSGLAVTGGRVAVAALHEALPSQKISGKALTVLSCDRERPSSGLTAQAVRAVIAAGRRAGDTVICDLPRSLPEPAVSALRLADLTVVVVPAEVRACAAAARLIAEVRPYVAGPLRTVVRGPAPSGLTAGDVAEAVGLDVLAVLRRHPGLPAAIDRRGLCSGGIVARGPVARTARQVLTGLDAVMTAESSAEAP